MAESGWVPCQILLHVYHRAEALEVVQSRSACISHRFAIRISMSGFGETCCEVALVRMTLHKKARNMERDRPLLSLAVPCARRARISYRRESRGGRWARVHSNSVAQQAVRTVTTRRPWEEVWDV